ncbi:MAG TPA: glycosyltransferase family A protein [Gaiellaceae bacterium]|nr:glycosyltransferase family A protein [Gaiellaceae bacterium]
MKPLVSVMIGAYNAAPYLGEAIESVLAQDYEPFELIVVDDGSTDGTADVARSFPGVQVISQENGGNGAARNTAIAAASGDLYAFLDADDRFTPGKLSLQKAALDADASLDMVFGHVREFLSPELDEEVRARLRPPAPEPMPWTAPNLMLIRREAFERVGLFTTSVRVGVTVDWFARADEAGLRYTILPDIVLERRLHTQNNGLRESASRSQYLEVIREAMVRRRAAEAAQSEET